MTDANRKLLSEITDRLILDAVETHGVDIEDPENAESEVIVFVETTVKDLFHLNRIANS